MSVLRKGRNGSRYHTYDMICIHVGLVHAAAAAAELVMRGYKVYPAQQTQPGPPHRVISVPVSVSTSEEGRPRRRKKSGKSILQV